MKITANFKLPRFSFADYQERLNQRLGDALAESARQWLNATALFIPVYTGASRATFSQLASQVGFNLSARGRADIKHVEDLGNSVGEFNRSGKDGLFTFTYATNLKHLIYNEFNNANLVGFNLIQPGPYDFQGKGETAFKKSIEGLQLPDPYQSIYVKTLRV